MNVHSFWRRRHWQCFFGAVVLFFASNIGSIIYKRKLEGLLNYRDSFASDGTFDPSKVYIERSPVFFPSPDDFDYCQTSGNNIVLSRGNNYPAQEERIFSIRPADFAPKHNKTCKTTQQVLQAIKFGKRLWESNVQEMTMAEKEQLPSTFIPRGCDIPTLSPARICNILNQFSHIIFGGDSLSRHLRSGFLMALSNDLVRGGIVSRNRDGKIAEYSCRCDGQFSEHGNCREGLEKDKYFHSLIPFTRGLCPQLDVHGQTETLFWDLQSDKINHEQTVLNCTKEDDRGVLFIANGGLHYGSNSKRTYQEFIIPMFQALSECSSHNKVTFIWNSYTAMSEAMNNKYPLQSVENGKNFNREIQELFYQDGWDITIVDWMNFTDGAMTSDGVHHLAQVNYFKAQYLLYLASLMTSEEILFKSVREKS